MGSPTVTGCLFVGKAGKKETQKIYQFLQK
jgi:hypothetical protein